MKNNPNTVQLAAKISPELYAAVEARAEQNDLTMSQVVRRALTEYLAPPVAPFPLALHG